METPFLTPDTTGETAGEIIRPRWERLCAPFSSREQPSPAATALRLYAQFNETRRAVSTNKDMRDCRRCHRFTASNPLDPFVTLPRIFWRVPIGRKRVQVDDTAALEHAMQQTRDRLALMQEAKGCTGPVMPHEVERVHTINTTQEEPGESPADALYRTMGNAAICRTDLEQALKASRPPLEQ